MTKKIVTLYIDDTSIRLMVVKGRRIKEWANLSLEPGLIDGGVVINEAEVAKRIRQLFKERKVSARKVIVGLSGLHCFTRPVTLPQLPRAMITGATMRVAESTLPLSLDQLYIAWQAMPVAPAGKMAVFIAALRRKVADSMVRTLRQASLKPSVMDIKPLALARLVKEASAIIVDVQPGEFDIIIMVDGVPQPIRTITFPREVLSWEERFPLIRDDLDKTIKFYATNNPEKPLPVRAPVFVSGELAYHPDLCQSLARQLGCPVSVLSSPLGGEVMDLARQMVNIGLALKERSLQKAGGASVVNLNLLPLPYRPKPVSLIKVVAVPAAVVLAGLMVPMSMLIQGASADYDEVKSQLDSANRLVAQRQSARQELSGAIDTLEKEIGEVQASRDKFAAALKSLEARHEAVDSNLEIIIDALPGDFEVTGFNYSGDRITINGNSLSEKGALTYANNLNASGLFSEVVLSSMKRVDDLMSFSLILRVKG